MSPVLKDFFLPDTPLRGIIARGGFSLCAYIGVPENHWLADLEMLEFPCHWGITFRGPGNEVFPQGWYWYGWDYAHAGDYIELPAGLEALLKKEGLQLPFGRGHRWTVDEVEHEIIYVAVNLLEALKQAEQEAEKALEYPALR